MRALHIITDDVKYGGFTKQEILDMATLYGGQYDDLKIEDVDNEVHTRVWVSRIEYTPDGLSQVTVEKLIEGEWETEEIF